MEKLNKAPLPPKLRYRIRRWIEKLKGNAQPANIQNSLTAKFEEALALKELRKN